MESVVIKKNRIRMSYYILFFSIFVISYQLRGILLTGRLQSINFIAMIAILCIGSNKYIKFKRIGIFFIGILSIIMLYSQLLNYKGVFENIVIFSCIIIPMGLIFTYINNDKFEEIFFLYMKYFNYLIILLFTFAVIDKLFGNIVAKTLSNFVNDSGFIQAVNSSNNIRYYSFMGHPLYNTQLFLMFYTLNVLSKKYFPERKSIKTIYIILISLVGILFTASKTGILLLGSLLLFMPPYKKKKILYLISIFLLIVVLYQMGFFDNLIYRFTTQTLTSGRNEVWFILKQSNIFPIKFFSGYGSGFNSLYNYYFSGASMAFEYPFNLFQLEYGQLSTIFIYAIIFCYPFYKILKTKEMYMIIAFIVIFIDVNTYNGIGLGMDIMLMFVVFVHILINMAQYIELNRELEQ